MRFVATLAFVWVTNCFTQWVATANDCRVAYGNVTDPEKYPYVVHMFLNNGTHFDMCTGSLISRSVVLTAGHCLKQPSNRSKYYWSHNVILFKKMKGLKTTVHETILASDEVFIREDEGSARHFLKHDFDEIGYSDIGLIVLKEPAPICTQNKDRNYSIARLPIANIYADKWKPLVKKLEECTAIGYGETERGIGDGILRELRNVIIEERGNALFSPLKFKGRVCQGDSGGPVVCSMGHDKPYAVGIISYSDWGIQGQGYPKCYSDVRIHQFFPHHVSAFANL
ncbi:unnamed protein product, partial [Toxocara canis]|uniref:Peptidase S1 domain-containing protein n=1 Tax=Toxocara canis TaxID=6265 RepID=A0A183TXQ1_TOXCA